MTSREEFDAIIRVTDRSTTVEEAAQVKKFLSHSLANANAALQTPEFGYWLNLNRQFLFDNIAAITAESKE